MGVLKRVIEISLVLKIEGLACVLFQIIEEMIKSIFVGTKIEDDFSIYHILGDT